MGIPLVSGGIAARGALLALVLGGCTAPSAGEIEAEETQGTRALRGLITIERTASADVGTGDVVTTNVSAKFMRLAGVDAEVAEGFVGVRPQMPEAFDCVEITSLDAIDTSLEAPRAGSVELVDVGDVALQIKGERAFELVPRAFPDIGDFASGVFYTSPDAQHDLPLPASYVVRGTGAPPVEPFTIPLEAPSAPKLVSIGGLPPSALSSLSAGDVTLRWSRERDQPTERSWIYVDVGANDSPSYRCAFPDQETVTLPADVFRDASRATIALHRVTENDLAIDLAADASELSESLTVRFDLAQTFAVSFERAKPNPR